MRAPAHHPHPLLFIVLLVDMLQLMGNHCADAVSVIVECPDFIDVAGSGGLDVVELKSGAR